jgi:hypothetical protein
VGGGIGAGAGEANCLLNSSIVKRSPILRLHSPQIGIKLSIVVFPPLDSGMLCPTSNANTDISRVHHWMGHFDENVLPKCLSQTSSRSFLDITFFFAATVLLDILFNLRVFDLNQFHQKELI